MYMIEKFSCILLISKNVILKIKRNELKYCMCNTEISSNVIEFQEYYIEDWNIPSKKLHVRYRNLLVFYWILRILYWRLRNHVEKIVCLISKFTRILLNSKIIILKIEISRRKNCMFDIEIYSYFIEF